MKRGIVAILTLLSLSVAFAADHPDAGKQGWLGVSVGDMTPRLARDEGIKIEKGAYIREVLDESPADKAGIKEGDVIIEFAGKKVEMADDLVQAVRETAPGTSVEAVVFKDGANKTLKVVVGTMHHKTMGVFPHVPFRWEFRNLPHRETSGLELVNMSKQLGAYFGAPEGKGVLVEEVEEGSAADKAGFKAGDVIVNAGSAFVEEVGDVEDAMEDAHAGDKVDFVVLRKGASQTLTLTVERRHRGERFESEFPPELRNELQLNLGRLKLEMHHLGTTIREQMDHLKDDLDKAFHSRWS